MSNLELELVDGETVADQQAHAAGNNYVSDGNSRWVIVGDIAYFVVTKDYKAPDE